MLFGRHNKGGRRPPNLRNDGETSERDFYTIDFDMMVKGSVYKRRNGLVRQFGVTVNGSTRLVTSGDTVDRATYRALVQAGALRTREEERNPLPAQGTDPHPGGPMPPKSSSAKSTGNAGDKGFPNDGR